MTTPHLHTVGLVVGDMAVSLAFYRALGLDPDGSVVHVFAPLHETEVPA